MTRIVFIGGRPALFVADDRDAVAAWVLGPMPGDVGDLDHRPEWYREKSRDERGRAITAKVHCFAEDESPNDGGKVRVINCSAIAYIE